ncbi:uncharacterized protein LOC129236752 isoform X1 [Anastrepha obliqua]|uniref:uncharacterized protein LOC129236752 isoform X1 n=1 Tax=Anastrepha obliqua TaxID=95512 RepID=UPI00240A2898|nr:uncharacterized protein LOC129236752 isoform X1 [Anastrepha obliqua]XP_054726922.1 uncharacterized protein LOC129236752 isoform X1 [Anastrepha obliqua]
MVTILDLPDECLINICKRMDHDIHRFHWVNVCKKFEYIYYEFCHGAEVNDYLVKKFGHQIGTDDFPMQIIKRIYLSKSECSKRFLNKLRISHPEIEEANLFSFTDEHMAELLPLPNLKVLMCIGASDLSGRNLIDLCRLTELHIYTDKLTCLENLIHITYKNPLRVLVIPNDQEVFSEKYAFEMVKNLKYLEKLVVEYNPCKSWQLIGTLPLLKKLVIWNFANQECDSSAEKPDLYITCAPNHDKILFDELRKRNQLEELTFHHGNLSEFHLNRISELKSLRILKFWFGFPRKISLDIFKELINLEELVLGAQAIIPEESLEFIQNCQKLRVINFGDKAGINANFFSNVNDIVSKRKSSTVKHLTLGFSSITNEMIRGLCIRTPVLHIRITILRRKYVAAEESYLKSEEECVSQSDVQGDLLKRKFSVMNMVAEEREVDMEIIARMAARAELEDACEKNE